ncbi:hypothetical protein R1sor_002333 [Riccia sorocarpa]|uniref:Uncharacterized protein n=1 Tax=Riccia sorocarpa TaxID=122646 RepID=A0ABD3H2Q0_9MARC
MLTFDSLVKKIKTKHSVTAPWFVTQNVTDAALLLWIFNGDNVIPLGVILKTIAHTANTIEFLSWKKEGGFYRYELQTKYMDRKQSELALPATRETAVVQAEDGGDEDDIEDEEFAEDIRQTQRHEKDRWDAAKKSFKDKGKAVDSSQPRRKNQSTP